MFSPMPGYPARPQRGSLPELMHRRKQLIDALFEAFELEFDRRGTIGVCHGKTIVPSRLTGQRILRDAPERFVLRLAQRLHTILE